MKTLPEEVILEILLRLPVKSLLRFRCVSKSWVSLISDPHFAKLHFELYSQHTPRIVHTAAWEVRSVDLNASLHDDSAIAKLDFPLCKFPFQIMGSCRGFLLLVDDNESRLFLWNPSTGACKRIPKSPLLHLDSLDEANFFCEFLFGFGYDAATDDYLIVQASYDFKASVHVAHLEIFSLRTNSWEIPDNRNYPYTDLGHGPPRRGGSIINGAIHWLALHETPQVSHEAIIAFDLTERNLREVPMPDDFVGRSCDLKVLGECLSLIDTICSHQIDIWMMREYGVKSSWTMYITVSPVQIPTHSFSPTCITKDGQVVGIYHGSGLIKYNERWAGLDHCETGLAKCNEKGELLQYREYYRLDPETESETEWEYELPEWENEPPEWQYVPPEWQYEPAACVYTETLFSLPCE